MRVGVTALIACLALAVAGRAGHGQAAAGGVGGYQAVPPVGTVAGAGEPVSRRSEITCEEAEITDGSRIQGKGARLVSGDYELTAAVVSGDLDGELRFSGTPALKYRGETITGDMIRFWPRDRSYRVEGVRTRLSPGFLQDRVVEPLSLQGVGLGGRRDEVMEGSDMEVTTCLLPHPHYRLLAQSLILEPGRRLTLRRARVVLWGRTIAVLPSVTLPLDKAVARRSYTPEFGHSADEGWFVKTAFNMPGAGPSPGVYRLDAMERKGLGVGLDRLWRDPRGEAQAVLYGTFGAGTSDLSGRLQSSREIGQGQRISLTGDFRHNSYLAIAGTDSMSARMDYEKRETGGGFRFALGRQSNSSSGYGSTSDTATVSESTRLGARGTLRLDADYSSYATAYSGSTGTTNERLTTRMQADWRSDHYVLQCVANKSITLGAGTSQSYFSGVERLPEISLSSFRFTGGLLSRLPATFQLSVGDYREAGTTGAGATGESRAVMGFDLAGLNGKTGRLTYDLSGGFMQYLYNRGAAQYVVRATNTVSVRMAGKSGLRLSHSYQEAEGGTPFRFDRQSKYHTLNADLGWIFDKRYQLSARVGYDFGQEALVGTAERWQTLSLNALAMPVDWMRVRGLASYNPNTGEFTSATADVRLRGPAKSALDMVARYDPRRHQFGQLNAYVDTQVGREWRVTALAQYNGYLRRFESRNLQLVRDLHCMEASLTYMESPFGYRAERQIYFQLRIKALPSFQRFGVGGFGQALDTGMGETY